MNKTTKETNGIEEEQEEYVSNVSITDTIKDKLVDSSKKYPVWSPKIIGDVVHGTVENVEFLQHLNENNGGWIVRMVDDVKNKFVVFPNKVMLKKLLLFTVDNNLVEILDKTLYIQYDGEKQPRDTRNKPYKTYSIIEG